MYSIMTKLLKISSILIPGIKNNEKFSKLERDLDQKELDRLNKRLEENKSFIEYYEKTYTK